MSGAMEQAHRQWELGTANGPDTFVCPNHISEPAIIRFVKAKSEPGYCDYCKRNKKVIPLSDLVEYIMKVVGDHYTDPANFMAYVSAEGGHQGTVYTADELLQHNIQLDVDDALFTDFYDSIDQEKPWGDELEYYDSPADVLIYSWGYFKRVLKHRSRYFFNSVKDLASTDYGLVPEQILAEIGSTIRKYKLVKELPAGTRMYRCRQHTLGDVSVQTFSGMTSPPDDLAHQPNRMSPAGVSMFYGAFDEKTAVDETIDSNDKSKPFYTVAEFIAAKSCNVVDLSAIPGVPSIFDLRRKKDYYPLIFLKRFVQDLIEPIARDERIHINYVPTQVVTEYLRFPFSDKMRSGKRIDGLIYPSSKTGKSACVLFFNNKESKAVFTSDPAEYRLSNM